MSRCFPFPAPGYSRRSQSNEALILSIKLQEEKEKSKLDREGVKSSKSSEKKEKKDKKEKKEKKEKERKEKKDKKEKKREERKSSSGVNNDKQKVIEKLYEAEKCGVERNAKCNLQEDATGQLESSSVTEEHGRPCLQNVSCSSDSTSNSSKRKRLSTPPSCIQSNGNVLRIRLSSSSQKRDEPSTSGSKEQEINGNLQRRSDHAAALFSKVQPCSNAVRTQSSVEQRDMTVKAPQVVSQSSLKQRDMTVKAPQVVSQQRDMTVPQVVSQSSVKQRDITGKAPQVVSQSSVKQWDIPVRAPQVVSQSSLKQWDVTVKAPQVVSHSASTSNAAIQSVLRRDKAVVVPNLAGVGMIESAVPKEKLEPKEKLSSHEKKLRKKESKYTKLFEAWVPPSLQSMLVVDDVEDDDWLFGKKGEEERATKRMKGSDVESCGVDSHMSCASYALQPRAVFLPDAGIYALPYTVPF